MFHEKIFIFNPLFLADRFINERLRGLTVQVA
jgi:hypothetical protein